jgi:hypothetical protein
VFVKSCFFYFFFFLGGLLALLCIVTTYTTTKKSVITRRRTPLQMRLSLCTTHTHTSKTNREQKVVKLHERGRVRPRLSD